LRIHRQLGQFRHDSPLKAWIGRVAYSLALRHLEKNRIRFESLDDGSVGAEALEHAGFGFDLEENYSDWEIGVRVRAAVDALPPLQRMLVSLYHLEEITIPEISQITGLPAGTIKSHLFRTRRQLRHLLEERFGEKP
jgi:RNA polymerase sigma-70 factor (ECF subfamily)